MAANASTFSVLSPLFSVLCSLFSVLCSLASFAQKTHNHSRASDSNQLRPFPPTPNGRRASLRKALTTGPLNSSRLHRGR